jgi:uncharacterized protein (DUF433 family)
MDRDFVERRDDGFYLAGSRVPLDCVVREFREGQSPEAIRSDFPTLSLEQVYGAITFYLGHKDQVDNDMAARERLEDAFSEEDPASPDLKEKLERATSVADAANTLTDGPQELPAAQVSDRRMRALPLRGRRPWLEP